MVPKVSVIVPVYRVERYIRQCIDSILTQTFTDWELLLVDDGSPDSSGLICEEYALKDNRIRVFHKANNGVSSARNLGIEKAKGEWITFIDADDFVGPKYLEQMNKSCMRYPNIDLIHCGCQNYIDGATSINQEYEDFESNDCVIIFNKFRGLVVSKWFKRDIIKNNSIRFDENIKIAEDYIFTIEYILHINRYAFNSCVDYFYRIHSQSATHSEQIIPYDKALYKFRKVYDVVEKYIESKSISIQDSEYRHSILADEIVNVMLLLFKSNISKSEVKQHIDEDFSQEQLLLLRYARKRYRILAILIKAKQYFIIKNLLKLKYLIAYIFRNVFVKFV